MRGAVFRFRRVRVSELLCILLGFLLFQKAAADVIHLRNGKKITAERVWEEGDQIRYERSGNVFGFSKALVIRIETGFTQPDLHQPSTPTRARAEKSVPVEVLNQALDLAEDSKHIEAVVILGGELDQKRLISLESEFRKQPANPERRLRYQKALRDAIQWQIERNDLAAASSLMDGYLGLDPDGLQANLTHAWLRLKRGELAEAENVLLKAKVKHHQSAELHYLLGTVYYHQDRNSQAVRELQQSLDQRYRAEVEALLRKIQQENLAEDQFKQSNSLHFVVRYEGSERNQALGQGILAALERSFMELVSELNYSPRDSIAVVLYPDEVFQDVTRTPGWVGALNDGKIRFPIKGLTFVDDRIRAILKHELTHSFIRHKAGGNCPLWLNEGLAQYLSGDSARSFLPLAKQAIAQKRFPVLSRLEGSFIHLDGHRAAWAYQESLLATEFLVKAYGLGDIQRLLENTAKAGNFEAGLRITLRSEYAELQRQFEEYIRAHL